MSKWYEVYDGMFFIAIAGGIVGLIGLCVKACVKCKWIEFNGCGIRMVRNPALETDEIPPLQNSPNSLILRKQSNSISNRNIV